MAFGFPAYHSEKYQTAVDADLKACAFNAARRLGYTVEAFDDQGLKAKVTMNMASWGEILAVRFVSSDECEIKSHCQLPTQCFDWGKNKKNLKRFLESLETEIKLYVSTAPPVNPPPQG